MSADTRSCPACFGRGFDFDGQIDRDAAGLPAALKFGNIRDCGKCHGSGRVPKAPSRPKPPLPDTQERLWR